MVIFRIFPLAFLMLPKDFFMFPLDFQIFPLDFRVCLWNYLYFQWMLLYIIITIIIINCMHFLCYATLSNVFMISVKFHEKVQTCKRKCSRRHCSLHFHRFPYMSYGFLYISYLQLRLPL